MAMTKLTTVIQETQDTTLLAKPEHNPAVIVHASKDDGVFEIVIADTTKAVALEMLEYAAARLKEQVCSSTRLNG